MLANTKPVLRQFINWARSKPADEFYNWHDIRKCACAQFWLETKGDEYWGSQMIEARDTEGADLNSLAAGDLAANREIEHTFGALVQRAEAEMERLLLC